MGGPFWAKKEERAWSIPKGELEPGEDELAGALREFAEELGTPAPDADYERLGEFRYASGKVVVVFVAETPGFDPGEFDGGAFRMEWPPRSGRTIEVPELDRGGWVPVERARELLVAGQVSALDALSARR